jgi:uncharacterized DUF497 family protein
VTFEWNARKAAANLKKHKVAFVDAAITIGCTINSRVSLPL